MATNAVAFQNANQLYIRTNLTQTFVWNNRYETGNLVYENVTDGDVVIPTGTVLGRVMATQKLVEWTSGASDGSQYPVGVLAADVYVSYGESYDSPVSFCVAGDVARDKIVLQGSDTLETECGTSDRSLQDMLASVSGGIRLVQSIQNTIYDNA